MIGALVVAALLVGAGLWLALPQIDDALGQEGTQSDQALATPDSVVAEASAVLPTLAVTEDTALAAAVQAQATVDDAARTAQSQIINTATAEVRTLQTVAAGATNMGLPSVPSGYTIGNDVTGYLGAAGSLPYSVDVLDVAGTVGGTTSLATTIVGGTFATGSGGPRTGVAEVDALVQQAGVLDSTYDALMGQDLNDILAGLGQSLPVPEGLPIPGGLPTDGLLPGMPSADAGAVNPDDEGAANALAFGYGLTDGVTGAFAGLSGQASTVLADQAALVDEVNGLADEVRALEADGVASIQEQLDGRIAKAGTDAQARIDALLEARAAFEVLLVAAQADAQAELEAAVEDAQAGLQEVADGQVQFLTTTAEATQADATARIADLDTQTQAYLALLAEMEADGADVTLQVAAVQAEAASVRQAILAHADAQQASLLAAAGDVEAQAQVLLAGLAVPDHVDLAGQLDAALSETDRALAFGQAMAKAGAAATIDAHTEKAAATVSALHATADARVEEVRSLAEAYLVRTTDLAASGQALVLQVQADGTAQLDGAISYVEKVAEDYATIPEPERQAAAEALLEEAGLLTDVGTGAVGSGLLVFSQFGAIASGSASLQSQIAALAL